MFSGGSLAPDPRLRSSLARPVEASSELTVHSPRHLGSEEPSLSLDLPDGPPFRQLLEVSPDNLLNLRTREGHGFVSARR